PLEDVRAETRECARMQLEHRSVPEDALRLLAAQHQPRPTDARLAARPDRPPTRHTEVRAHGDPAFEAKNEVLSVRVHRLEHAAVDLLGDALRLRARMRRLGGDALADE